MIHHGVAPALAAAALLGFRHGGDYDHVAAIADLAGAAKRPAQAVGLAVLYGLGHSTIVTVLSAIRFGLEGCCPRAGIKFSRVRWDAR